MSTENLKSTPLTNLDATPIVANTSGLGAVGHLRSAGGTITVTTGYLATSTYALVRIPSAAVIKHVFIGVDTTVSTFVGDIGFYYSTSTVDGTIASKQGTAVNTTSGSQLFGAAVDLKTKSIVDYVYNMPGASRNKAVWDACGLTSDPGGYFDLVIKNTSTNSGAAVVTAEVQYVI